MYIKRESLSKIQSESILIGILHLIGLLCLYTDDDKKRGHPYVHPTTVIMWCCVVRIWMRIPSINALHYYLSTDDAYHRRICNACGLDSLPDRRTFDRRFKVLPIKRMIARMGNVFFLEGLACTDTASVDSFLLKARGPVWHKSSMKKKILPISGIDTDARWGLWRTLWQIPHMTTASCTGLQIIHVLQGLSVLSRSMTIHRPKELSL